ncbi:glycerol-3-phosphate acyltransferase [Altericista sp. CCNU0014]|uniref:glycerol-3-phosphate acyltransferase n=1 Tax=Altericista sp. CCNU0014 TaxID=3082949 RepID=UPI00384F022A
MSDMWGIAFLAIGCPAIGGMPITGWIVRGLTGQKLTELGTGNIGVSAAFYHGGTGVGVLSVLAEAAKGVGAVLGVRALLPDNPTLELAALVALLAGRYWIGRGAGTTNVVWGVATYDWRVALTMFLASGGMSAVVSEKRKIRWLALMALPMVVALLRQGLSETLMAIALSGLLAWIYLQLPEDLALPAEQANAESQGVFQLLGGTSGLVSLDRPLLARKVGQKAATLAQLKQWGYAVPEGWVLPPGDDAEPLIKSLHPSAERPWVVRSSAMGEDSDRASAAGQYQTVLDVTSREGLRRAIAQCQDCYDDPVAAQYRQSRGVPEGGMAVIVQVQIQGEYSGVAFSRDPSSGDGEVVAIEGLPGKATHVVSGHITPERYSVRVPSDSTLPEELEIQGEMGRLPRDLIGRVALLVRDLESRFHGVPQDMEWTYDGQTLWVLQTRTITTLLPIWTRRIAAEVIPGVIRPLTWSINQPLTCGVWAGLFRSILGGRSDPFQVRDLATLHYGHAYFNATLLGELFRRMGLPAESLEFLTRGAPMGRPSPLAMLKTLPGLTALLWQEWTLPGAFRREYRTVFAPLLAEIAAQAAPSTAPAILERIDAVLLALRRATLFSILAPLSAAVRQKLWRVEDAALDASVLPETAALRSLRELAALHPEALQTPDPDSLEPLHRAMEAFLAQYGYLSDVATDISVPTWKEDPQPLWLLLKNLGPAPNQTERKRQSWPARTVQRRLALKGKVAEVYSRLLAELRYALLALEQDALSQGLLRQSGDLFFLTLSELREWVARPSPPLKARLSQQVAERSREFELAQNLEGVPAVVYGTPPPLSILQNPAPAAAGSVRGIGASPGIAEGTVEVLRSLRQLPAQLSRQTILVVPYTDAGWSPILAQVGGIVAEAGGSLSHGAIIAREYGIPAVMDVDRATQRFKNGQRVRIDGYRGIVEILQP